MEKKQKIIQKIAYGSFYLAVIIEILMVIIDKSAYTNPIEGRLFQITFLLFFVKVCLTKCSWKEYITIFMFCVLGAISYFVTDRNEVIRLVMLVAACKNVDMRKCLKLVFFMTVAGCVAIILLSLTGVYGDMARTMDYGRGGVETRYTLGMGHPNALQCMVWALTTLGLYLYGKRMKFYGYLLLLIVNGGFFLLTDSKTSFLVTIVTIFLAALANRKTPLIFSKIGALLGAAITAFSIAISVNIAANAYRIYDFIWFFKWEPPITDFYLWLNDMLNGRIRILVENDGFEGTIQTWTLFSRPENNYFFDMGWIRLFYWYGIIPATIFLLVLLVVFVYCYRKRQFGAIVMITSFALYSVIEAHAFSVYLGRNYVFFLLGLYWYKLLNRNEEPIDE